MADLPMVILIAIVIASLYLIIKGADYFVKGAASVSRKIGISTFVVGLTVVAMGTSAPELFVNVIAASSGATALSIGNILGSNAINILLGLGIAAIFVPLSIKSQTVWKELPFSLLGAVMIFILGSDLLIDGFGNNVITRTDGLALLTFFIIFMVYTFGLNKVQNGVEKQEMDMFSWARSTAYIVAGLAGLIVGGKLVVESATSIAEIIGISENLIGLTVVAIGTSLPEIVTAVVGVRKGFIDMVVGGVVGSNIFNALWVLGVTATIAPLSFTADNITDAVFLMAVSVVFFIFMFVGKKQTLERWQGWAFVFTYIAYMIFAILRG